MTILYEWERDSNYHQVALCFGFLLFPFRFFFGKTPKSDEDVVWMWMMTHAGTCQ